VEEFVGEATLCGLLALRDATWRIINATKSYKPLQNTTNATKRDMGKGGSQVPDVQMLLDEIRADCKALIEKAGRKIAELALAVDERDRRLECANSERLVFLRRINDLEREVAGMNAWDGRNRRKTDKTLYCVYCHLPLQGERARER